MTTETIEVPTREIAIPGSEEHCGWNKLTFATVWTCLVCGGERGEPFQILSYDGSRRMQVSGWVNPCGHVETYTMVRRAYKAQQR